LLDSLLQENEKMLIQGDVKNLVPIKCFIKDDQNGLKFTEVDTKFNKDEMVQLPENPFCPGGDVSEDGELIIQLWRDGKLNEYYRNCEQERAQEVRRKGTTDQSINPTWKAQEINENQSRHVSVTLDQKKEKIKSLCCFFP